MATHQENRIERLKNLFAQSAHGVSYSDLGSEGDKNEFAEDLQQRLAIINSSLVAQLIFLNTTSLDQVSVCLEMMRHLHFFGKKQFPDLKDFVKERNTTGIIGGIFSQMCKGDLAENVELLGQCAEYASSEDVDDSFAAEVNNSLDMLDQQWDRAAMIQDDFNLLKMRDQATGNGYDLYQKPDLACGSPEIDWMNFQSKTIGNMRKAVDQMSEYAMTTLVKIQFVQYRIMPDAGKLTNKWFQGMRRDHKKVEDLIERIDTLSQMRALRSNELGLDIG